MVKVQQQLFKSRDTTFSDATVQLKRNQMILHTKRAINEYVMKMVKSISW